MKNRFAFLSIIFLILISSSCNPYAKEIVGKWYISAVTKEGDVDDTDQDKYIIFNKDGTMIGGSNYNDKLKHGNWKINKKTQVLTIKSEKKYNDDGDYKIIKMEENEIIIQSDKLKAQLTKATK